MAGIILPSQWTSQPQYAAQIDRSNSIGRDVIFASTPFINPTATKATRTGVAWAGAPTVIGTDSYFKAGSSYPRGLTTFSLSVLSGTANASQEQRGLMIRIPGNSNSTIFGARLDSFAGNTTITASCSFSDFTGASVGPVTHGVSTAGGVLSSCVVYVPNSSTGLTLYVNGASKGTASTPTTTLFSTLSSAFVQDAGGGTNNVDLPTSLGIVIGKALTPAEVASLSANPWQIFAPLPRRYFLSTAVATAGRLPPRQWTIQPQIPVRVNQSNPLTRGLVFAGTPVTGDVVTNIPFLPFGSATRGAGLDGRSFFSTSTSADGWYCPVPSGSPLYAISSAFSIAAIAKIDTASAFNVLVSVPYRNGAWASPFHAIAFFGASTATTANCLYATSSTTNSTATATVTGFFDTSRHVYGLTCTGTSVSYFRDGRSIGTESMNLPGTVDMSNRQPVLIMNHSNSSPGEGYIGSNFLSVIWNRALSNAEQASFAANPWQIFAPLPQRLFDSTPITGVDFLWPQIWM